MTKIELVKSVHETAESRGVKASRKDVEAILDLFTEALTTELKAEGHTTWPGMVKIILADTAAKAARKGRNPRTGAEVEIAAKPAGKKLRARFSKALKEEATKPSV